MSCKLVKLSCINDLNNLKRVLLSNSSTSSVYEGEDSFNLWTESGWRDEEEENWINECLISLSPASDLLALALKQKAVFLTSKWLMTEENEVKMKFYMTFGDVLVQDGEDEITALLCLPIASQKKSLQGSADWTCVIVGFDSGHVRMYTEKAEMLLSQLLHEEQVTKLKCQTCASSRSTFLSDHQTEELLIIYNSVVVCIDGFSLFQTLRACRSQLARAAAGNWEVIEAPPLTYKKWTFQDSAKIMDCENVGTVTTSPFDHLASQSLRNGLYASIRSSASVVNLYITVGSSPYIGFYQAVDGTSEMFLSDVAHAVANKLKSFFINTAAGSLLGWNQKPVKKQRIEQPTTVPLRYGIFDRRRCGTSINISPNKLLAVVTDAFGRVILYDIQKGIAIRIWKGYRDAQCGWIQVQDSVEQDDNKYSQLQRNAQFLIIYAPRRGIVEVWSSQQGPRVAAFNVGKSSKLLNPGYGIMGLNVANIHSIKFQTYPCFLLNPDGDIFTIAVPFHCALSDRNSKRARDIHLLKEFKTTLRSSTKDRCKLISDVNKILLDMKTANMRQQAIECLLCCNIVTVDTLSEIINELSVYLQSQDLEQLDYESKLLLQTCCRIKSLITTYDAICTVSKSYTPVNKENPLDIQLISTKLNIAEVEVGRIMSLVTLFQSVHNLGQKKVRFVDTGKNKMEMSFNTFVHTFVLSDSHLVKTDGDNIAISQLSICLSETSSEEQLVSTGEFLFSVGIQCDNFLPVIKDIIVESQITTNGLITVLLHYWLSSENISNKWEEWLNFQYFLKFLCTLEDTQVIDSDHVFPWDNIKLLLSQSTNNISAYLGAIITRSVSAEMASSYQIESKQQCSTKNSVDTTNEKLTENETEVINSKEEEKDGSDESDWEAISLDVEQWSLLVKQMEDVLVLSILLKSRSPNKVPLSNKKINISLLSLQNGGPGIMTDLVAAWCVDVGIGPEILNTYTVENEDIFTSFLNDIESKEIISSDMIQNVTIIKGLLGQVRKRFPRSMDPDALLANCSWEYMVHWDKNHDVVSHLKSAIQCLSLVMSAILRSGIAYMMWKTFVQKRFESLVMLVEKVGKTPKERLCRRDVEMNDIYLEQFVDFCCQLLEIMLEANVISEVETIPMFPPEEMWQGREVQGPAPFVTLALQQPNPNYPLVHHHFLLATSLLFVIAFQQKNIHLLSLYDTRGKSAFFKELQCNVMIPIKGLDTSVITARTKFLLGITSAIAQNISHTSETEKYSNIVCTSSGEVEASKWFNPVIDVARGWDVDLDEIRRHYVCELYNCGHDTLAEEVMSSVTDQLTLGLQLLVLAGQRIYHAILNAKHTAIELSRLPPSLSAWLKTLDKPPACVVPVSATAILLQHIINFLPENQIEQQMALMLLEAVHDLQNTS